MAPALALWSELNPIRLPPTMSDSAGASVGMPCPGGQGKCSGAGDETARLKMNEQDDPGNTQVFLHELPARHWACGLGRSESY